MIELEGLTKRYGEKVAVNNLTFTVRPGIVTGFLGPNGSRQVHDDADDARARPSHGRMTYGSTDSTTTGSRTL